MHHWSDITQRTHYFGISKHTKIIASFYVSMHSSGNRETEKTKHEMCGPILLVDTVNRLRDGPSLSQRWTTLPDHKSGSVKALCEL